MDHLPFSWWFGLALRLPRQEGIRRRQKRPGLPCPSPSYSHSAKRRGGKGMAYLKKAEARIEYRGETAFFGEPDALLPGQGTRGPFLKIYCFSFQPCPLWPKDFTSPGGGPGRKPPSIYQR